MSAEEQDPSCPVPAPAGCPHSRADGSEARREVPACCTLPQPPGAAGSAICHGTAVRGRTAITYSLLDGLPGSLLDVQFLFHLRLGRRCFPGSLSPFSERDKDFTFFFFKAVWRRSCLQYIIWSQIESSKTFQERMSPPLAWNSVVFVVSGSLPDFSEIAEHMQLCPNLLGYRDWGLLEVTPSLFNLSSSYWITGGTKL